MRLKHLQLQGFKTFAPRTELRFGEGLTAIVGPNGSGKSNVADAVRWVLGEQSLSNLRAKKTEDLIFAGSSKRAPLGMAEVSITLDNSDHLLPLDFSEVTLTRRAYRSGDNEYYINKSRVRLREILDVAATLGQAYTVVGQGLVDAALSLRPEERRELFEEAAAIRGYFMQREDALRRLARTEENVTRLSDLASELEPQVRRMERQAKQAQEYGKLEAELRELLERWYASRWTKATTELRKAEEAETECERTVEARRAEAVAVAVQLSETRTRVWQLVDAVSEMRDERLRIQSRHAAQSQSQAVLAERLAAAVVQRKSLEKEREDLHTTLEITRTQIAQLQTEATERRAEIDALQESGRDVARKLSEIDAQIADRQGKQRREAAETEGLQRSIAGLESRLRDGQKQRDEQAKAVQEGETTTAALSRRLEEAEAALNAQRDTLSAAQQAVADTEGQIAAAQSAHKEARTARATTEEHRHQLARQADALASQLASLAGEQQANLYGGVRAVTLAAREGKLTGYVGTVAELLRVPAEYETAIEAALGGRLQDVVVERWADAERAISMLKAGGAGRATFLPLDTLRATPPPTPPKGAGIIGPANELVEYDRDLETLANSLLARLLVVEDLPSARRTIESLPANSPWTLATLGGEVVRPGGSVTGGAYSRSGDGRKEGRTMLGRERKRRELEQDRDKVDQAIREAGEQLEEAVVSVRRHESSLSQLSVLLEERRKEQAAVQMAYMEQQGTHSRLQQEIAWRVGLLQEARKGLDALDTLEEDVAAQRAEIEALLAPVRERIEKLEREIETMRAERARITGSAGAGETRLAVLQEALRNVTSKQEDARKDTERLERRLSEVGERIAQVEREEAGIIEERDHHTGEVSQLAARLKELEDSVGPSEQEVKALEAEAGRVEGVQAGLQEVLLESETLHSRASVERQRCVGVLDSLRIEISEELGVTEQLPVASRQSPVASGQSPVEVAHGMTRPQTHDDPESAIFRWESVWAADQNPKSKIQNPKSDNGHEPDNTDLERRVYALKAKISRIGPVNPLAMEEHAALSERHEHLTTQLADLTGATHALQRVIAELDRTMSEQFAVTFEQVNEAFQYYFKTLFAGGTARLELTNPEDVGASGIELMAQPPGKRMQPLAALSGGERALTSAALLFALLKVRPVPFCVLDEVDAALDESNVTRFRSALQELEAHTQFVVITHNRGTIEAADVLYGVSMAGDGTSQLLSLKVEG